MRSIDEFQISSVVSELLGKFCLQKQISPTDTLAQQFYSQEKIRVICTFESLDLQKKWLKKINENHHSIEIIAESNLTQIPMVVAATTYVTINELSNNQDDIRNIFLDRNLYLSAFSSQSLGNLTNFANELGLPTNSKIPIAIIDSGVDSNIKSLEQNIELMLNYSPEEDSSDHNGHGTYTASILVNSLRTFGNLQQSSKSSEITPSAAQIYSMKIFTQEGKAHISDLVLALGQICFHSEAHNQIFKKGNVKIVLIPASSTPTIGYDDLFSPMFDFFLSHQILCVCSAGNFGPESLGLGYPGIIQSAITVGSISDDGGLTFYSSRGSAKDGTELPKFNESGENIQGIATPQGLFCSIPLSDQKEISITGTSTSAALVAAKLGLIKLLSPALKINDLYKSSMHTFSIQNILQPLGWIKDGHKSLRRMIVQSLGFSIFMIAIFIIAIMLF